MNLLRLIRLILALLVSFIALIGLSLLISRTTIQPFSFKFNPPNCYLPCFLGITPGKTTYKEAKQILDYFIPQRQYDAFGSFFIDDKGAEIHFQLGDSSNKPQFVTLLKLSSNNNFQGFGSVGELMKTGLKPTKVFRLRFTGPNTVVLAIEFDSAPILVAVVNAYERLTPMSPIVTLIQNGIPHESDEVLEYYHLHTDEIQWRGFVSVQKYLNTPILGSGH